MGGFLGGYFEPGMACSIGLQVAHACAKESPARRWARQGTALFCPSLQIVYHVRAPQRYSAGLVAGLHRNSAYLERRAALASLSVTSGTSDNCPVAIQSCWMTSVSPRDIPGTHEIGMQPVMALPAEEEQTLLGPVGTARISAPRTGLTGIV